MSLDATSTRAGGADRPTVSPTSAQRFAARVRARRLRRWLIAGAVLLLLAGAGWLAVKSPWATVRRIEVSGTHRVDAEAVRAQGRSELGQPLVLARVREVAARVARERLVRSVRVQRAWPSGLRIVVQEREPVAALPQGGGFALVDGDGVVIQQAGSRPAALPRIDVTLGAVAELRGCLAVLHALPPALAAKVASIGAGSPEGIQLRLSDGSGVDWGDPSDSAFKAEVLLALLPQHAQHYDVRAPQAPAVRKK